MDTKISLPSIWPVSCHTNYIGKNSTFVAIKGDKQDGICFVQQALQKGARTIVAECTADISAQILEAIQAAQAELVFVPNARRSLALLSADAWNHPAQKLKIIAITGTKGKTTTAWLLHHMLQQAGKKVALLSSVKNKINTQEFDTDLTTPHPDYLHAFFQVCVNEKIEYVIMEVAAQAYSLHRVAGLIFDGLIFTNFEQAHGEFYETIEDYFKAKHALFDQCKPDAALIINDDDAKGSQLLQQYAHAAAFTVNKKRAFYADINALSAHGIAGTLRGLPEALTFNCPALIGTFNVYNIVASVAMAHTLGISAAAIAHGLTSFAGAPGRLERYSLPNGAVCFIDHAHNPLSFKAVLPLLRSMTDHLIVIAGAGGDRDAQMRPILGQLIAEFADHAIFTTDNPRSENPADIINAMYAGVAEGHKHKVACELDREAAIKKAYGNSRASSIIALLGKGPEQYQIIGNDKLPFSERAIVQSL